MIIKKYKNGVLISEEVVTKPASKPQPPKPLTPITASPVVKKSCGCGKKK